MAETEQWCSDYAAQGPRKRRSPPTAEALLFSGKCTGIMVKLIDHPMITQLINKGFASEEKPDHSDYSDEGFARDMWTIINESESDSPKTVDAIKQHFSGLVSQVEEEISDFNSAFPESFADLLF